MPLMSKKKDSQDRHGSGFMIRLPEVYRSQLRILRPKTRRPMTTEIQIALEEYLAKFDLWPPADHK
jgi:hypothetical protein